MISSQYVIIGAGFAGAATAYHLARLGVKEMVIVEQESVAGVHSSGRNAAMARQVVPDPAIAAMAREGALFMRNLPADWPTPPIFQQRGSLLLSSGAGWQKLVRDAEMAQERGVEVECWSAEKAKERVAVLEDAEFDGAVWCSTDGVVDIHALLGGYLKIAAIAGARVLYGRSVCEVEVLNGRVAEVKTSKESIKAEVVINAAGAWTGAIGKLAGALEVPLRPLRRHLFVTVPLLWVNPSWPFVWDISHDLYFRPEAGGLLLCPCDQDEMVPGMPPTDSTVAELLADKIRRYLPKASDVAIKNSWAGLRTFSADGRFVIGWDPKVKGFFWVAGLGGHGMTTSYAVGGLAARLILGEESRFAKEFSPHRFL